jgi:hypothetical protein
MEVTEGREEVLLPSKGIVYPEDSPLRSGKVFIKYMTAKEENILTNKNYLDKGISLEKLLDVVLLDGIKSDDLLIGDKNAVLVALRALNIEDKYKFTYAGKEEEVNLLELQPKELHKDFENSSSNEFTFKLPKRGNLVTFKLLTSADEKKIDQELEGLKKLSKVDDPIITTRLKYQITSIDGDRDIKTIREYVDKTMLAFDSRKLRNYIREVTPDIDLTFYPEGREEGVSIPMGINFFWPDFR